MCEPSGSFEGRCADLQNVKQTVWVPSCLGNTPFLQAERSRWYFKRRHTKPVSQSVRLPSAHRFFLFTLKETPCKLKSNRIWQSEPCSRCADEGTRLSQRTARILRHAKGCHEEDGACSWAKTRSSSRQKCQTRKTSLLAIG